MLKNKIFSQKELFNEIAAHILSKMLKDKVITDEQLKKYFDEVTK